MQNKFVEIPANEISKSHRKPLYGIGINDADYLVHSVVDGIKSICPYYTKWSNMIERCYSEKYQVRQPTYKGCSVFGEWLTFSNFKKWMKTKKWEGMELDKDCIKPGNKVYCPEFCAFVSTKINKLLVSRGAARGKYPQGVYFHKHMNRLHVRVNYNKKTIHVGYFYNQNDASNAYIKAKVKIVMEAVSYQEDARVANGLKLHAELLLAGIS